MNSIVIQPGAKPFLLFIFFSALAASPFYTNTQTVPYWAGAIIFVIALMALFTAKRITMNEEQVSIKYVVIGKTITMLHSEIESIQIFELPSTMASRMGLMRRGEIIRIRSMYGGSMSISTPSNSKFDQAVQFLEDYYGDKLVN